MGVGFSLGVGISKSSSVSLKCSHVGSLCSRMETSHVPTLEFHPPSACSWRTPSAPMHPCPFPVLALCASVHPPSSPFLGPVPREPCSQPHPCFLRSPLSVDLERYYQTENEDENPFICSQPRENGMRSCRSVPTLRGDGGGGPPCGLDYEAYNSSSNTTCVNWNQYYTNCSAGEHNPFKGAINFDNIGYAWIAIFQVGQPGHRESPQNTVPAWSACPWGWDGVKTSRGDCRRL